MLNNQGYPLVNTANGLYLQPNKWLGAGGTANATFVAGTGITSVAYNASTGKYLVTLSEAGASSPIPLVSILGTGTEKWNVKISDYIAGTSFVVWVYDDTTLAALASTAWLNIVLLSFSSDKPQ